MTAPAQVEPTIEYIKELVPLRFPVLLVDRVLEWTPGERIVALKCFSVNETLFGSHLPPTGDGPPEALLLESMVQVAGLTLPKRPGQYVYLRGMTEVIIAKRARYGDVLITKAHKTAERGSIFRVKAISCVEDEILISGEITYVYLDSDE